MPPGLGFIYAAHLPFALGERALCVKAVDVTEGSEGGSIYLAVLEMESQSIFAENS